jgi:hypothetical protein
MINYLYSVQLEKFQYPDLIKPKKIRRDEVLDYWSRHIDNTLKEPDNSLKDKVLRTIVNHAKWNVQILDWDLAYSEHSSTFCLFKMDHNVYTEIDGMLYRAIGRRLIAKLYEKFNIKNSRHPVQPYGSLFNTISRGIHKHATDYLVSRNTINFGMFKTNQHLFWVKYGNKKIKDIPIVIKNVHWVRNGELYHFMIKSDRFRRDSVEREEYIKIYLNKEVGLVGSPIVDDDFNCWLTKLMNSNVDDIV